jgi:tRNA(fMet)-specific endonuclease VapC
MSYFLDTSACIAILRNKPKQVRDRANAALGARNQLRISSIVLHELWYGAYKSRQLEESAARLQDFIAGYVEVVEFSEEDARLAGQLRAGLEGEGRMIGAYDTLIAAQCLRYNFVLVTSDVADFRRVQDLRWENWAK